MSRSLASTLRVLALALGALLALPPSHAFATAFAPNARQQSERLLAEGDAASTGKRWDEAISKYRASYYGLPPEDQASYMGSLPVRKAMRAYAERIAEEQDPDRRRTLLGRQRVLLEELLDAVAAKPGAAVEVGADVIAELEETRRSIDAALAPPKETEPSPADPTPSTEPAGPFSPETNGPTDRGTSSTTTDSSSSPQRRSGLGLGLTIGGSTLLAAGLGVSAGWWTVRNTAQENVDGGGAEYAEGTEARETYLAGEKDRARTFLVAGSVVAGVGLATAIGGVVVLVLHRQRNASRATSLRLSPVLSPTIAGLALHRRF